jgi:hypothetical protein
VPSNVRSYGTRPSILGSSMAVFCSRIADGGHVLLRVAMSQWTTVAPAAGSARPTAEVEHS